MKGLKTVLVVIGIVALISAVPGVILPWSSIGRALGLMGLQPPPEHPTAIYCLRLCSLAFALIGIFFLVLASDPLRYRPMLVLAVWGCWLTAVTALVTGWLAHMQPLWYLGDAVSSAVAAVLMLAFWPRGVEPAAAEGPQ